jgi:uncharacterized membrane protein
MKSVLQSFTRTEKFYLLVLAAVSVIVMLPVLFNGIPYGYDLPHHYQCAMTFYESFLNGDIYPSWSLNRNYGFGGMESRLYPPLSHYSLAIGFYLTGSWHIGSWIVFTIFTFLGALGIYLWAKEYLPARQAVFAGCFYALMPYHLNQLYNTFFFAEFVGSSVLPFSFYFVSRACRRGKTSDVVGLAISFAALVLTHLPLTVIGSLCLAIYALTLLKRENLFLQIGKLSASVLLGLAASSFFWTKVLLEKDLMAKTAVYADPWLDYRLHFLLTPIQNFDGALLTRIYETSSFYYDLMFLMTVVLVVGCTIPFLIWLKGKEFKMKGVWILFGLSVFLAIPFSRFVWDALKPLQETQFPWRWLAIVCIGASMLSACYVNHLFEWFKTRNRPLALIICGCILSFITYSASQVIRQAPYIEKGGINEFMDRTSSDIGFTFWWTIWTRKAAFDNKEKVSANERKTEIRNWTATDREFQIGEGTAKEARVATFYHPNWKATVNNIPTQIKSDENGAILIPIPTAKSSVKLNFVEPFAVKAGQWTSAFSWLGFIFLIVFGLRKKFSTSIKADENSPNHKSQTLSLPLKLIEIADSKYRFLLLAGICLLTVLPTLFIGIYKGVDLSQHVQFSSTFYNSILNGDFYPSWAADENLGYGGIGVRFYPPLTPLLFALARILTGNWHTATCIVFFLFTLTGAIGVYLLAKEFISTSEAVLAGAIFTLMPYHLYQIQNGSQFAEFAGCSVIPFSFLFVTRISRRGTFADVLGLAISFALLILTHLPSTVIGALSLLVYALLVIDKQQFYRRLLGLAAAVVLALAASSIYWLKVVSEMKWLRNTRFDETHFFDYSYNFLLTAAWFGDKQLWYLNFIFLSLVFVSLPAAAVIYFNRAATGKKPVGLMILLFAAFLMCLVLSKPVWMLVPFLSEVQFPWRWLTIVSVCGAIIWAASVKPLANLAGTSKSWNGFAKGFAVSALMLFLMIYGLIWSGFSMNYVSSNEYENYVSETSRSLGSEWFWTAQAKKETFQINEKVAAEGRKAEIAEWNQNERVFTIEAGANQNRARIATLFYPHWKATVNGAPVVPELAGDGAMRIAIPAEKASVRIWFDEPFHIKLAFYLSACIWVFFLAAAIYCWRPYFSTDFFHLRKIRHREIV